MKRIAESRTYRAWFMRGLRLSLAVGLISAAWDTWDRLDRYQSELNRTIRTETTYRCGARLSDATLNNYRDPTFGNFNLRVPCGASEDFWASPQEIADVRSGQMVFEPAYRPFYPSHTATAGIFAAVITMLLATLLLGCVRATSWVWRGQ